MTAGNAGENSHMKGPTDYSIDRDSYDDSQTEENPIQVEFTEDEAEFDAELEKCAKQCLGRDTHLTRECIRKHLPRKLFSHSL